MAKILDATELIKIRDKDQILFVSGCFDILHIGHIRFLSSAKEMASPRSKLVVAVLTDRDVERRKGKGRPVFKQSERVEVLSHINIIDYVLAWEQPWEDLRSYITILKPQYLAAVEGDSGMKNKKEIVEKHGGNMLIVERIGDFSTSQVISKLNENL